MKQADRHAREAAALRANLLKRKEQMRQRQAPSPGQTVETEPAKVVDAAADEGKKTEA